MIYYRILTAHCRSDLISLTPQGPRAIQNSNLSHLKAGHSSWLEYPIMYLLIQASQMERQYPHQGNSGRPLICSSKLHM